MHEDEPKEPEPEQTDAQDQSRRTRTGTGCKDESRRTQNRRRKHRNQQDAERETASRYPSEKRAKKRLRRQEREDEGLLHSADALIAAFAIPVIIMLIIFVQRGIFPFGEETFLRTDMYHQYAPFFSEFQYKLTHGGSLLYSWDVGMGVNFSALYAYYLASPVNWLLFLCPKGLVIEFMTYQIVIKIGLCGLTMAYYLRKHCRTHDFGVAFFGIFYALSGYMAAYSWNIMWLDCIILFPLIVLGLEHLVKDGKGMLYCMTLGLSILSNYYISIMTCIFMVLYFIAMLVLDEEMHWEKFIGRGFQFAVYSLLAGGLAAVVLLPEIFALQMTASGDVSFPKTFSQYFPIFDMIARHIGNVETEIGLDHWPNVYCGVAVLMFFHPVSALQTGSGEGKSGLLRDADILFRKLFLQYTKLYLARFPLSEQPALQAIVYLHFPGAVCLLSGLHESAGDTMEACDCGICRSGGLCAAGTEAGNGRSFPFYCVLCGNSVSGTVSGSDCPLSEGGTLLFSCTVLCLGGRFD